MHRLLPLALLAVSLRIEPFGDLRTASIRGIVYDSVGGRVLTGADVQLVDVRAPARGRLATSDSLGAFSFRDVAPGSYVLGFVHDVLDSLGLAPPRRSLTVQGSEDHEIHIGIPSPQSLVGSLCRTDVARDSSGLFIGRVREGVGRTIAGAVVSVGWMELRFTRTGLQRTSPTRTAETSEDGQFAICGIPIGSPIVVRAWSGRDSTGLVELDVPLTGLLRRDLVIGRATATVSAVTEQQIVRREGITSTMRYDTTSLVRSARGVGRLRGTVRLVNGSALADARVTVWGTGLETSTDASGAFALDSVPVGTQTLVARSIGFAPYRAVIDVSAQGETTHDLLLAPFLTSLDTMRVRVFGAPLDSWRQGFDSRRQRGFGDFLDERQIERINPTQVSDLFRDLPGIDVLQSGAFGRKVVMRGRAAGAFCVPAVFVDGLRFFTGADRPGMQATNEYAGTADLEYVVNPRDVKAVEVYPHDSSVPLEYDDPNDGCGSIVIWTGTRRR